MARKPRVEFPGALYHVIARGNNRQIIFHSEEDYLYYLDRLQTTQNRYDFSLYGFCLMSNHFHLLILTKQVPLSHIMRITQTAYAQYFNRKNKRKGHVFESRYKAILCDADKYLLELIRYIHLNPVRAGIVKEPQEYQWSSHRMYLGKDKCIVDKDFVLRLIGHNEADAKRRFHRFVLGRIADGKQDDLYKTVDRRFLGDDDFVDEIKLRLDISSQERPPLHKATKTSMQDILSLVAEHFLIDESDIAGSTQARAISSARHIFIYLARERFNFTCEDIARTLKKDGSTISHVVRKMQERLVLDKNLKLTIDDLSNKLTQ